MGGGSPEDQRPCVSRELIIRPEAEIEIGEAYEWYEARSRGLGADFLLSVEAVLRAAARNPLQSAVVHPVSVAGSQGASPTRCSSWTTSREWWFSLSCMRNGVRSGGKTGREIEESQFLVVGEFRCVPGEFVYATHYRCCRTIADRRRAGYPSPPASQSPPITPKRAHELRRLARARNDLKTQLERFRF